MFGMLVNQMAFIENLRQKNLLVCNFEGAKQFKIDAT
jgi:hypothetical protein